MPAPYQTVLFDLDGTLIDSTQLIFESYAETMETHGFDPITEADVMVGFGVPLQANLRRLSKTSGPVDDLVTTYTRINDVKHDRMVRAFDGIPEALEALASAGVRMAVVTGKRRQHALRGLERCKLDRFFEMLLGPEDYSKPKPNPEPVQEALQKMGMPLSTAVYVGDAPADMACGRAAGVTAAGVAWAPISRAELEASGPDIIIERPEDLVALGR